MLSAQVPTLIWFSNALFLGVILDVIALALLTHVVKATLVATISAMGAHVLVMKSQRVVDRQILYLLRFLDK